MIVEIIYMYMFIFRFFLMDIELYIIQICCRLSLKKNPTLKTEQLNCIHNKFIVGLRKFEVWVHNLLLIWYLIFLFDLIFHNPAILYFIWMPTQCFTLLCLMLLVKPIQSNYLMQYIRFNLQNIQRNWVLFVIIIISILLDIILIYNLQ